MLSVPLSLSSRSIRRSLWDAKGGGVDQEPSLASKRVPKPVVQRQAVSSPDEARPEEAPEMGEEASWVRAKARPDPPMRPRLRTAHPSLRPLIQREEFEPYPQQLGHEVPGTQEREGNLIRERVRRTAEGGWSRVPLLEYDTEACTITSLMEIEFSQQKGSDNAISDKDFAQLKARLLQIGNEKFNDWMTIKVGEGGGCKIPCAGKDIKVRVVVREGSGPFASQVRLVNYQKRADSGQMGTNDTDATLWHELGHIALGAADEYAEAKVSILNDQARPANRVNEDDYSLMANQHKLDKLLLHPRHFSHIREWMARLFPACSFETVAAPRPLEVDYIFRNQIGGSQMDGRGAIMGLSLGLDLGIPLDRLRRVQVLLGPRLKLETDLEDAEVALLLGLRLGLGWRQEASGFGAKAFVEGGGLGVTSGGRNSAPYIEGGGSIDYPLMERLQLSLEAARGLRSPFTLPSEDELRQHPYFRMGLSLGVTF
ncbi:MAG: hypothetical protein AAFW73_19675 [Bacteroidota bacterium]